MSFFLVTRLSHVVIVSLSPYMILNTIGVSQLISFYQYVKNETNISQRAINNGRWSILLWYVVQHVIDRCRPHSLDTTSAAGVANLSGRPLSGPRTDGDQRVLPRTSRDATRRDATQCWVP
jgi:hypothetical protein